ncbi:unnamed protein product [Paramecium primaurelia]|uniref:NB-ARC domain-containing protein n=1 Tax=Paramecium primaurelia TaxID=5886 RepID=A0A8S1PMG4_PARPR|nr:unnamed protein product [Paramecium primaurelia]
MKKMIIIQNKKQIFGEIKQKLILSKCVISKIQFGQEYLIKQIKKIYLQENEEEEEEIDNSLNQKYKDFKNNEEWKIKQGLILTIIYISSNSFTDTIYSFCQKALIQLWVLEKDQRVRGLLKNQNLISLQMQILQKDWQTQHDRIAGEMQKMLKRIDELQESISREANLNKRDIQLKEMDETTSQLDEYIHNISEMGQQLRLITDFLNHIRKGLQRVEGKINQMKEQLDNVGNDIKFLRGKSVIQLLEIRKWKVLNVAAEKNVKSIYVPLKTQEKDKNEVSRLMNFDQFDDKVGEVNEFLLDKNQTVLLIHGLAGSGKSTTAKKIEEFIWKLHDSNKQIGNFLLIPVYLSLPSLKNPVYQAVEESLHSDDYGFDDLQLKECKEMLQKKEFRFIFIMDSYDEMKLENIQKNLYITNKLRQNWSDPLVIFTTRSDIFTSNNYADWFAPEDKKKFKEIKLLQFEQSERQEYLMKFTIQSIKMLIFDVYEWQVQTQNQKALDLKRFEQNWEKLKSSFLKFDGARLESETLLNEKQIDSILLFLKDDELIALKSNEAIRSLSINLKKLWSFKKYEDMMMSVSLTKLVETPYMMEIIVQVLPNMILKATEIINIKQNFLKNFSKMLKEFYISKYRIQMYKSQQKKHLLGLINEVKKESQAEIQVDYDDFLDVTPNDIYDLEVIDYHQIAFEVWNNLEENSIPQQLQISQEFEGIYIQVQKIFETDFLLQNQILKKGKMQQEGIIQVVCDSLKEYNLTIYDFYCEFINYYHLKQIEKQRNLGKSIDTDRFLHDLLKYSIRLAKTMSKNEKTQVQYKQQGFLYQNESKDEQGLNEFFNYDDKFGAYKKDIISCSLVQQKGANFQFAHKSIQEFLIAADLYEVLVQSKDFNIQILNTIIDFLSKENNQDQDCLKFLENIDKKYTETFNQIENISHLEKLKQSGTFQQTINSIISLIRSIKEHDINVVNYSTETYAETRQYLIQKISQEVRIIEFLKFLVHLTKIDNKCIISGSNALNILVEMKVDLTSLNFENIKISNTSLIGGNFTKCNLTNSKFDNVNINGINLSGAQLFNCNWKQLKINDLYQIDGHTKAVWSVCFSPDANTLASGSGDNSIRLWDVKTGKQNARLDGHTKTIYSVCFSPYGNTLASGSEDNSIRLWDVKTGQQKARLDGHTHYVNSVCFSPDGNALASGSSDGSIRLWDVKTGKQKAQLDVNTNTIYSVCFSPDGNTLASGSTDNSIHLWDVKTAQYKAKLDGHTSNVYSVCFSPNGTTLASGSADNSIRLWDVKTGQQIDKLDGHTSWVQSICFSSDGNTLGSGGGDLSVRLWDVKTGIQKVKLDGHTGLVQSVCFSPDRNTLASGSWDKSIRFWDVQTEQYKVKLDGHQQVVWSVCFSPDGNALASGSADKSIRLWDVKTGKQKAKLDGHTHYVYSVCFSPDGSTLASGSADKSIYLWDVKTGQQKAKLDGHTSNVQSVCFSPDGTTLASGSADKSIYLWDVKTGKQKAKLDRHTSNVYSVCFSSDGTTLASGSADRFIYLWDIKTGQQKAKLAGHEQVIQLVCFSPDGNTLASGSWDNSIRLWDVKTGQQKAKLAGHDEAVYSVCFSPDGNALASGSEDKSIRLWDVKTGYQKTKLDGHEEPVISVCFSPDRNTLASGNSDNSIRLWDLKTGQQKAKLDGHDEPVISVCFSPDGNKLASGSNDNSIRLWDVKTGQQIAKLDGHGEPVISVCFSPGGKTLASRSVDQFIHLWDLKTEQEISSQDNRYNEVLENCKISFQQNNPLTVTTNITFLRISQTPIFQAQGALVLKGEFFNYKGFDLRSLLKLKESFILES